MRAADANRAFYSEYAEAYDSTEACVTDPRERSKLLGLLESCARVLPEDPRCLDACGGSGNASLEMLRRGWKPVTVDVSPKMLAIYTRKAQAEGYTPDARVTTIEQFLAETGEWDLIVFSSALHHLDDYAAVFHSALRALSPRGALLSVYDPLRLGWLGQKLRRADYLAHVLFHNPQHLLHRARNPGSGELGRAAERWVDEGIDHCQLISLAELGGFQIRASYYYSGRFAITSALFQVIRHPSSFSLVVRR